MQMRHRIAEIRTIDPLRLEGDAQSLREPPQLFAERRIGRRVERQQSVQWGFATNIERPR